MKRKKSRLKKSLRKQIVLIFAAILSTTVIMCWVINAFFLERIYINQKEKAILNVYEVISYETEMGRLTSSELSEKIERLSMTNDVSIAIMTSFYKPIKIYSNEPEDKLVSEMINNLSGFGYYDSIIEENKNYILLRKHDKKTNLESIEMWGNLPDGSVFLFRTNIESVHQSAVLASKVSLLVGLGSIMVGSLFVFLYARKITKPVLALADIAEKMSEMDFNSKYTGNDYNEIGVLGQSINRMSQNLEDSISHLKIANLKLTQDIEKKNEIELMRKDFVANVSHELKTPLALIEGYAEGLKEGVNNPEDRDYYCDVIIDEAEKMNVMVRQLINLNQLENGGVNLQIERFDVTELIKNYVQKSEIIFEQNNITVSVPEQSEYVWADEFKVEEILMNYISNAIHYCESDSAKRIDVSYKKEENNIRINVFNTGSQIPDDAIEHIWDKFYKAEKARSRQYGGSGVGLSIVKAIIEAHGQKCGVENVDDGVNFWFTLDTSEK